MSITAYVGLPGQGKSYGVVENVIAPACKKMRTVYTNIPCNTDVFLEKFGIAPVPFNIDDIKKNPKWFSEEFEAGAIFVIDECWRLWPAGLSANRIEESHKEFFAEHRHLVGGSGHSTEIILVTQDLSQIASFMRNLIETTFRVTKMSKIGSNKTYRVDVYSGAVTGPAPPIARREREIPGRFKKEIFALYKSHIKSDVGAGDESRSDGRFNALGGLSFKLIAAALVFLSVFVYFTIGSLFEFADPSPVVVSDVPVQPPSDFVPYVPDKPRSYDFMNDADRVYVSYNGGVPSLDYLFRVVFGDGYSDLTANDFIYLGYDVDVVSQCFVKITNGQKYYIAVCEASDDQGDDFFSDLTGSSGDSGSRGESRI